MSETQDKMLAEWFWTDRWQGSSGFELPIGPRGLYREMLTQAWRKGGSLPNNEETIRRICGVTEAEWNECWPSVKSFWKAEGDRLVNDTQLEVYAEALTVREGAKKRAKAASDRAAEIRKGLRDGHRDGPPLRTTVTDSAKTTPPSPSPSPSLTTTENTDQGRAAFSGPTTGRRTDEPAPPVSSLNGKLSPERLGIVFDPGVIQHRNLARDLTALVEHERTPGDDPKAVALSILQAISTTGRGGKSIDSLDLRNISPQWAAVTSHAARRFAQDQGFELPE